MWKVNKCLLLPLNHKDQLNQFYLSCSATTAHLHLHEEEEEPSHHHCSRKERKRRRRSGKKEEERAQNPKSASFEFISDCIT